MQVTTLNKIINLFFVGTLVIAIIVARYFQAFQAIDFNRNKELLGSPIFAFVATLFILSVIMLLGMVVDSLANISLRRLMKRTANSERAMAIFFARKDFRQHKYLFEKVVSQFKAVKKYKGLLDDEDYYKTFAVGLFFHTASGENIQWVIQHYSTYLLATNYLLVLCSTLFVIPFISGEWYWKVSLSAINVLSIYFLYYEAIRKYVYSYDHTYRHVVIVLSNERFVEKIEIAK